MSDLKSRVAYLQGLSAGMDLHPDSKEGRLLNGIIQVLDEFAETVVGLEKSHEQLEDYIETVDEDLYALEGDYYEDGVEGGPLEGEYLEVDCPRCGETVCFDSDVLEDDDIVEVTCPNCDEVVFVNDDTFEVESDKGVVENRASMVENRASSERIQAARTVDEVI